MVTQQAGVSLTVTHHSNVINILQNLYREILVHLNVIIDIFLYILSYRHLDRGTNSEPCPLFTLEKSIFQ